MLLPGSRPKRPDLAVGRALEQPAANRLLGCRPCLRLGVELSGPLSPSVLTVTRNIASRSNSVLFAAVIAAEREPSSIQGDGLDLVLDYPLPKTCPRAGDGALLRRHLLPPPRPVEELAITVDGTRHRPTAQRMPRPDRFRSLHPTLSRRGGVAAARPAIMPGPRASLLPERLLGDDPDKPPAAARRAEAGCRGADRRRDDGTRRTRHDRRRGGREPPSYDGLPTARQPLTAICMATFNPVPELFQIQVDSIRAQTDRDWICLISDDCSRPDRFEMIREAVAGDTRFVLSRSDRAPRLLPELRAGAQDGPVGSRACRALRS